MNGNNNGSTTSNSTTSTASTTTPPQSPLLRMKEQKLVSKQIERQLKNEKKLMDSELKLLLLGTGDSGKSTIVKQMKIIHMKGYTQEDRINHKSVIYRNIFEIMNSLINGCEILQLSIDPKHNNICSIIADKVDEKSFNNIDLQIIMDIEALTKDDAIKGALVNSGSKFQIHSSAEYFINALPRIATDQYIPTDQDILCTRVMTTAVSETKFNVRGINFRMIDVGGQRGHRDKWIHHFSDVTAILFIVSLSEYDQVLEEDHATNRMSETIKVFESIINARWFVDIPIILFLNKRDLFEEKIKRTPINVCFTDYNGGKQNYEESLAFIKKKLLATNKSPKNIYTHVTTATDTTNISAVFDAVKDILTRQTMEDGGI
ncbi:G-protein subunit alpha 7 [Cavenderia fasciculata]|uniref:G-protein subunit alpha 7 n=1 Tax=Cavenderia fasciculata TaxID=261658 RepID=F4PHY6_CACFS|nr:G-protein subunit alpha 7 [Cavenderia fasciculata]EGG24473.1 G-protein subunit alpha 7 [Cavenderia fasciculata]|eukprot:XP_004362324.1 G-protein subunit alpha 7 [Cavenderia fasciculata]